MNERNAASYAGVLIVFAHFCTAACFHQSGCLVVREGAQRPCIVPRLRQRHATFASAVVHVDRRTLLVAGTSALVPAAAPRFANAAIDPAVLEKAEKVKAAIKVLAPNSGSAVEDMVGGKAVKLKGSIEDMQAQYRDAGCIVAVTLNAAAIKKVMSGEGLNCVQCGSDGGAAPPKFFLVMDSQGKSNKELQELGEVTGRVESFSQPGTFMELGAFGGGAPVFSLENLK